MKIRICRSAVAKSSVCTLLSVCLVGLLVASVGCGSGGNESGPLSVQEKRYIRNVQRHTKLIKKVDPVMTAAVLVGKNQVQSSSGLPAEQMNAVQKKMNQRRRMIRAWDKMDCPSQRLSDLCGTWGDALNLQYRWDDRVIGFVNHPYSKARASAMLRAGRRETQKLLRAQAEIRQIRRKAASN